MWSMALTTRENLNLVQWLLSAEAKEYLESLLRVSYIVS